MALASTTSRADYQGSGITGPFPYPFRVFAAADLEVTRRNAAGVETPLVLSTDFDADGVGDAAGGTITLIDALEIDEHLSIRRVMDFTQETSFRSLGDFLPEVHEDALDRTTMLLQQLSEVQARSLRLPVSTDPAVVSGELPGPLPNKVLMWNSSGTALESRTIDSSAVAIPGDGRTAVSVTEYLANNAVLNVLDYQNPALASVQALGQDLAPVIATAMTKLPARGGKVVVPPGQYKGLSPITPPARSTSLDGSLVELEFQGGAIVYSYDQTPGRSLFDFNRLTSQDGKLVVFGGIFDGTNATSTTNCVNVHCPSVVMQGATIRNFKGSGITFTSDLAVPPIKCGFRDIEILTCGKGVSVNNVGISGTVFDHVQIEASDDVGMELINAGQVMLTGASVLENNGRTNTAKENLTVIGATDLTSIGTYFEDDVNQAHDSIRVEADATAVPIVRFIGGRVVGYAVANAVGMNFGPAGSAVRGVAVDGVYFVGHKTGIKLGTGVQGYDIRNCGWSDNYNPASGTSTRITNNSNANGAINGLDRFGNPADTYRINGAFSTRDSATIGGTLTVGKTTSDQATGAGAFSHPLRVRSRVSSGAIVLGSIESPIGNAAMWNVVAGTLPSACTAALAAAGAGNVDNGLHLYKITFVDAVGESLGGTESGAVTVVDKTADGQVALTAIALGNSPTTARNIYRTKAGGTGGYFYVGTIADNATTIFTDNVADSALGRGLYSSTVFPPVAAATGALAAAGAGNVENGDHSYKIGFTDATGESTGGPLVTVTVVDKTVNGKVALTAIPLGASTVTGRRVYRTKVGGTTYYLVGTIADNVTTTFADNIADAALGLQMPEVNSTTLDLGFIMKKTARGVAQIGTMDDQAVQQIAGNVVQGQYDTTGFYNARLGITVAGVQLLSQRKAAVADVASANATDLATALTLANETKAQLNALLNRLRSTTGHGLFT